MPGGCVNERNTSSSRKKARLEMQHGNVPIVLVDERAHCGQGIGTRLRHRRQPQLAGVEFHRGDFREQGDLAARRGEFLGFFEAQADGVMIPGARFERGRSLIGDDAPIGDDDGACAHLVDLLQDVGGNDDQLVLAELVDQAPHLVLLIRIETVGRFIQYQHLRVVNQRLRQSDAAAKALRQRLDDLMDHRSQAQPIDDDGAPLTPAFAGQSAHVGDEIQELGGGHFTVARGALREISHAGLGGHGRSLDVVSADGHLSGGRGDEARDHAHGRGFARAIGAQESQHFSRRYAEGQVIDGQLVAVAFR